MSLPRLFVCFLSALLLLSNAAAAAAAPEMDYASLREDVVHAYAQQAAEMASPKHGYGCNASSPGRLPCAK